eukprot:1059465-Prymnesium_polylepis.1
MNSPINQLSANIEYGTDTTESDLKDIELHHMTFVKWSDTVKPFVRGTHSKWPTQQIRPETVLLPPRIPRRS